MSERAKAAAPPDGTPLRSRVFFGWYIALGGALSNFLVIGVAIFGFGVFVTPMREELGWSVAAISLGVSLRSFEQGLMAPLTGVLIDRLGPRLMALAGVVILCAGLVIFSQARTLPVFYVASLVMALGQSLGSFAPFSLVLMNWFRRKRGRAIGILNTGNGAGSLAVPVLAVMISLFGWRETLLITAGVILAIGVPLTLLLRVDPGRYGYLPDGDEWDEEAERARAEGRRPVLTGMSVYDALRTPAFYLIVLSVAANGTIGAWIVHQVPHLENVGFSRESAALITGGFGAAQIVLRFAMGWLGDTIGRRRLFVASFLLQGVGMLCFANLTSSRLWLLPLYYATFATGMAAWVVMQQTITADYFGTRRFATLRGLSSTLQMPVGVGAPVLAGWWFDEFGSYRQIFMLFALLTMTGSLWVSLIRRQTWAEVEASRAVLPGVLPEGGPDRRRRD
ncbi:MAG: MFS transporter [Chloroflexi bacterium]|nr:MFS transporter [Chloroflexota bacterium]